MPSAVTGAWKRKATYYDVPPAVHVADPQHQHIGHQADPGEFSYEAPPVRADAAIGPENFGSQEVIDTGGRPLDQTPRDHGLGYNWPVERTSVADMDTPGGADVDLLIQTHSQHNIRTRDANFLETPFQFPDERYLGFRIPGMGAEATDGIPALAGGGQRGLNGLSVNNPPLDSYLGHGFWPGTTEWQRVMRKFQVRIIQRHDMRALTPNEAYKEPDAPAPKKGTPYNSPFSALQRVISSFSQRPALRRQPPDLAETILQSEGQLPSENVTVDSGFWVVE